MSQLEELKNIGAKTALWLEAIGINSLEDIEALGVVAVYHRLKANRPDVSLNALWSLQGAVIGLAYNQLPSDMKQALLDELHEKEDVDNI